MYFSKISRIFQTHFTVFIFPRTFPVLEIYYFIFQVFKVFQVHGNPKNSILSLMSMTKIPNLVFLRGAIDTQHCMLGSESLFGVGVSVTAAKKTVLGKQIYMIKH